MSVAWRDKLLVALALGVTACATVPAQPAPLDGQWGGPHIGMLIGPAGTRIEYDCAEGTINGPIIPLATGAFDVEGTHTPGFGGPAIEGVVLPTYRVRFTGRVRGDRMTLTGKVENGVQLGPFALRRGAEPGIFRCL